MYSNLRLFKKDENGKTIKKSQNEVHPFKTKAGRTVYMMVASVLQMLKRKPKFQEYYRYYFKMMLFQLLPPSRYLQKPNRFRIPTISMLIIWLLKQYLKQRK